MMIVGLLISAYGFSFIKLRSTATSVQTNGMDATQAASVILFSIMIYVAAYALGLGNVPWMQSELFALNVRSKGSGLATCANWLANFVIGLTFCKFTREGSCKTVN